MSDIEKDDLEGMDEEDIVVITDEEGNEFYYREEMVIPVGDKNFAILVPLEMDEKEEEGCDCSEESDCDCCGGEQDAIIARIDEDENGEQVYVDPTDEEYEAVIKAYDEIMAEEEAED
jgi:uncharacterized protein YrzB (UPF0473 family)